MKTKVLRLTLRREPFELIAAEVKKIEYRDVKPYWEVRLVGKDGILKKFDFIEFRHGYRVDAPRILVEHVGTKVDGDKYCIYLGPIVKSIH
jgi:hypothetical protein